MKKLVAVPVESSKYAGNIYLAVQLDEEDARLLEEQGVKILHEEHKSKDKVAAGHDPGKHGFAFLVPMFAGMPGVATIVGAATLGIVGGAAGAVGGKIGNWMWPDKKEAK